jgi:hypothetical protein
LSPTKLAVQVRRGGLSTAYALATWVPRGTGTSGQSLGRSMPLRSHRARSCAGRPGDTAGWAEEVGSGEPMTGTPGAVELHPLSTVAQIAAVSIVQLSLGNPESRR